MREMALRLSLEEDEKRKTDPIETHERSIIIVGSKGVVSSNVHSLVRPVVNAETVRQVVASRECSYFKGKTKELLISRRSRRLIS